MVAVTFGLARYGYGLLLPDIRAELELDSAALGLIGTGSFAAYLVATVASGMLAARLGPRLLVTAGGALAVVGMLLVAAAQGPAALAAGLFVAGASSGLVYPPFADGVAQRVGARSRGRALAIVSAGTGWGVLVSVPIAVALGASWRAAWVVFAAIALAATLWAAWALRGVDTAAPPAERLRASWFLCPRSGPLLAAALLIGLGSSVYWTFAVDLVAGDGGMGAPTARLVLALVGAASLAGAFSGDLVQRLGARPTIVCGALALSVSLALLAAAPGSWLAVAPSAILFGAAYNVLLAVDAIWSAQVFAQRPATGLAAVMFMLATGLLAGPALAGAMATSLGLPAAFLAGAAVVAATALLLPREELAVRAASAQ
ncbi:MAG TPA: MFS transporter [Solirubrobacteraceae bacterium]|nr:MFS transporter [Solirubrobacteraceae bacterium]